MNRTDSIKFLFCIVTFLLGFLVSCTQSNDQSNTNIELIQRNYEEVWNNGDLAAIDEIYSDNYVGHDWQSAADRQGREGVRQHVSMYRAGFPNVKFKVEDLIAAGDKVVARWIAQGKHMGELMDMPATENAVTINGISIFRIANGKIEESWFSWDRMDMMKQMEAGSEEKEQ